MQDDMVGRHNVGVGTAKSLGMPALDFKAMHEIILPQRLRRGVSDLIAWDVAGAPPIGLLTRDGAGYSSVCEGGRVGLVPPVHVTHCHVRVGESCVAPAITVLPAHQRLLQPLRSVPGACGVVCVVWCVMWCAPVMSELGLHGAEGGVGIGDVVVVGR